MKKILIFLVMISLMVAPMVIAATQNLSVIISEITTITVSINPNNVDFDTLNPGTFNAPTVGFVNITIDANTIEHTNNQDITVAVTNISPGLFSNGLKLNGVLASTKPSYSLPCVNASGICEYSLISIVPTLDIPAGTPAGAKTGMITYTITGATPA